MITLIRNLHDLVFGTIARLADGWLLELAARFVFLAVLFFYYVNSFRTKVGEGFAGFFQIQDGAYFQIVPGAMEAAEYDTANVSFLADLIVFFGTYTEIILPILIVLGLFTRVAAIGMIGFIAVQTLVDIVYHEAEPETIGAWFDRIQDSAIMDQRAFWVFLLLVLVIKGGGYLSLDHLLSRNSSGNR